MKHALYILLILLTHNAFALYGPGLTASNDSFVVSLYNEGQKFCSGVLVSPKMVLTSGNCIDMRGLDQYEYSHALVYEPLKLQVKVGAEMIYARTVDIAPSYFEGVGFDTEDLAIIVLETAAKTKPIAIMPRNKLALVEDVTLSVNHKKVNTKVIGTRTYKTSAIALWLDQNAGACDGDSGGAVVAKINGQQMLAGVLMYKGEGGCEKKTGYSYFPKVRFSSLL